MLSSSRSKKNQLLLGGHLLEKSVNFGGQKSPLAWNSIIIPRRVDWVSQISLVSIPPWWEYRSCVIYLRFKLAHVSNLMGVEWNVSLVLLAFYNQIAGTEVAYWKIYQIQFAILFIHIQSLIGLVLGSSFSSHGLKMLISVIYVRRLASFICKYKSAIIHLGRNRHWWCCF
jgi:hypothetical protein